MLTRWCSTISTKMNRLSGIDFKQKMLEDSMISLFNRPYCKPSIRHPIESIKCFFISLKWGYQRVKKGYCDKDLMIGVNNWFLEMFPKVIDEIKKEKIGIPGIIHCEVIEEFGFTLDGYWNINTDDMCEIHKQIDAEAEKRWHDILSRISFLLRETDERQCSKRNTYEEKYIKTKFSESECEEIRRRYYEEDNKLEEYREQCKREAIELLLKWSDYLEI